MFSLTGWSPQIQSGFHVTGPTQVPFGRQFSFRVRDCHPLWSTFPDRSANRLLCNSHVKGPTTPQRKPPRFGLFRFRSPLLTESLRFLFLRLLRCFTSPGIACPLLFYSEWDDFLLRKPGYPIRKSPGHSLCAANRSLSQLITSFIACWHQGIHSMPLTA